MSIASAIVAKQQQIADCYTAISNKGGTLPATQNITNMPSAIISIPSGGGGGGDSGGKYLVQVMDYDGTVLKKDHLNTGATFTLPSQPSHTGLTFQEWVSPVTISNDTVTVGNFDITIGAVYTTSSGLNEFDIEVSAATSMTFELKMDGTKDWGDGTSDTTQSHTYTTAGRYTVTCNGTTMTSGSSSGLFNQSNSRINYTLKAARIATVSIISSYAFQYCNFIDYITVSRTATMLGYGAFAKMNTIKYLCIPSSITTYANQMFESDYTLRSVALSKDITYNSSEWFRYNYCLETVSVTINNSIALATNSYSKCYSLKRLFVSKNFSTINSYAFEDMLSCTEYDFSTYTAVPTLSNVNAFTGINKAAKILVPRSLEASWKAATNWLTFADNIVGV